MDDKTRRAEENRRVLKEMKYGTPKLYTNNAFRQGTIIKKASDALKFPFTPETTVCTNCRGEGRFGAGAVCDICEGKGKIRKTRFTCHTCENRESCAHAYGVWNLDGDCLVNPCD